MLRRDLQDSVTEDVSLWPFVSIGCLRKSERIENCPSKNERE